MPEWVVGKIASALNSRAKAFNGSKILVLGIAYKKNVDDMRESPSVMLMELLRSRGADVHYSDPWVPIFPKMREHSFDLSSVDLTAKVVQSFDCVIVATNHDEFDWQMIKDNADLVVDTRGVYRDKASNVISA